MDITCRKKINNFPPLYSIIEVCELFEDISAKKCQNVGSSEVGQSPGRPGPRSIGFPGIMGVHKYKVDTKSVDILCTKSKVDTKSVDISYTKNKVDTKSADISCTKYKVDTKK